MKFFKKCARLFLFSLLLSTSILLLSCEKPPVSTPLNVQSILWNWRVGASRAEVYTWLKYANPLIEASVQDKPVIQNVLLENISQDDLAQVTTIRTSSVDLRNAWLELSFQNNQLVSINLTFNAEQSEFQTLRQVVAGRWKDYLNVLKDKIWLSPDKKQYVFFGNFTHGWRYLNARSAS